MDIQEKLDRLRKTVLEDAMALRDQRMEELKTEKSKYIRGMKEDVSGGIKEYIKAEEAKLESWAKKERSLEEAAQMKRLRRKRLELQERVLCELREKLTLFTKEAAYETWLEEKLRTVDPVFLRDPLIAVCGERAPAAEEEAIRRVLPGVAVERDPAIVIGGFRLRDPARQVILDFTLDQRFEEAREAFLSGLQ